MKRETRLRGAGCLLFTTVLGSLGCSRSDVEHLSKITAANLPQQAAKQATGALRPASVEALKFTSIPFGAFCPTSGKVNPQGHRIHVEAGAMRGVIAGDQSQAAELAFEYRGPSKVTTPLADGEIRRQIGVKLRAHDTCNVVYVMWHVEPSAGVAVSVKRNPGQTTHAQCVDRGYINLQPKVAVPTPKVTVGTPHTLRAAIDNKELKVWADGVEVWTGALPAEAFAFDGAAGVRSDNGVFDFELRVPGETRPGATCTGQAAAPD